MPTAKAVIGTYHKLKYEHASNRKKTREFKLTHLSRSSQQYMEFTSNNKFSRAYCLRNSGHLIYQEKHFLKRG